MEFKHRALAALTALLLCLLGGAIPSPLFAVPALAENAPELDISVTAVPDALTTPSEVSLLFSLVNKTDALLESVSLTSPDGLLVEPIGDMTAGAAMTYTRVHSATQEELDAGIIKYIITCVSGSDHFSYEIEAEIQKVSAKPEVEFLRRISSSYSSDTSGVTVIYRLCNVGNVPVTAVSVTDPLGSFDGRIEMLDVGKSKVFVQHISVSEATDSSPTLTYSPLDSEDVYTVLLDPLTIQPAHGMIDAALTAGRSMFASDTAEVVLQLTNGGNVDYLDVVVYDDVYGGVIADSITVPAGGEPVEVAHTYPIREDSVYRWRVTGKTSAGDQIDLITSTEHVHLDAEGSDPLLTLQASTFMPKISRKGYVPVRLELTNVGDVTAANVRVIEETCGEICELVVVPTGDPTVYEFRQEIKADATLVFSAVYADSFGKERIATAEPLTIDIGAGGQAPLTADGQISAFFGGIPTQMNNSGLFMGMLIGSCAVLVVLIVILAVTSRRARIQRRAHAAARKQRLKEELGKTNQFQPIRLRKKENNDKK